ncbi:AdoMet-dependent rRNA methyltransferas-like protein spb1 [Calycina marina]|uniref:AdoMet-dependent rRNA methyltransferas-like protein spb1 n=1 Tax=Calycina marina TaxID=1763456 RepID=A0A9P7YZM3_9HELO|nr:AdoMet-dependent rRNA methyltransferas-like protein spb1 [Calycina marina]
MGIQKKHGKGRLDKWYKLAKEKGYRARAAFKLIQLNKKYGFLEKSKVLLDLCAAPGSWCQVAAETMPASSLIVGVDLSPIKAIPRVITFQSDITTDKCRATIRSHLKTWKADTVLHDGAPNVGTAWVQDSFNQAELVLQSMKLATEFLVEGGTFVTKVFRSKDYNSLLWVFNQLFEKVEATKPPSSRNVSAEIFVVCRGFKAPKRIDPKFLDPKSVFAELSDPTPNNEAKVFNPEIKKRKRDGYEEGNYTQFKEVPASTFINTTDPIEILGQNNKLSFKQDANGDIALAALDLMPETTQEIRDCCQDLKVLGRKEFKNLLKWRLKVREKLGFPTKKSLKEAAELAEQEVAEVEPMDEELKIQEELQALSERQSSRKKRDRRRENEKKQKEIIRMQLHMTAPTEIGLEQAGPNGEGAMFGLKTVDKSGAVDKIAKGKMAILTEVDKKDGDSGFGSGEMDDESDVEEDRLDREMDSMYDQYQSRKSEADAKFRAKKARKEHEDGDWDGFSADNHDSDDDDRLDFDSGDESSDDEAPTKRSLLTKLEAEDKKEGGLSRRAAQFFEQDIFKDIGGIPDEEPESGAENDEDAEEMAEDLEKLDTIMQDTIPEAESDSDVPITEDVDEFADSSDDEGFEVVKKSAKESQWEEEVPLKDGKLDIDIITAEAMTLAQQMASGQINAHDLIDSGFNKYAFKDRDGLPEWFLDDEHRHDKPHRPISAAGAAAIKEKMRALNARPIKKVREAKDRKKFHAAQRLEKLRKKSALLADEEGMTEKEKASSIVKLMSKAAKRKPKREIKVIVARGNNRAIAGRPRGVKGKYKIVDARLKKDVRAEKRLSKKKK